MEVAAFRDKKVGEEFNIVLNGHAVLCRKIDTHRVAVVGKFMTIRLEANQAIPGEVVRSSLKGEFRLVRTVGDWSSDGESKPNVWTQVRKVKVKKSPVKETGQEKSKRGRKRGQTFFQAVEMHKNGSSVADIAVALKVTPQRIYDILRKAREQDHVRADG